MPSAELRTYKRLNQELSVDEVQPTNTMICAALKNLKGRPAVYPNNENGLQALIDNALSYFEYVSQANAQLEEKQQIILDVDSFAVFLGVSRKTLAEYQKRGGEWDKTISLFKDSIAASKKQLAMHGKIPSILAVFDLCNNHQYVNTNEFKLTMNDTYTKPDEESDTSLEERIKAAGMCWDEERGEWVYAD